MTGAAGGGAGELRLDAVAGNATGFTIIVDERLVIGRQSEGPGKLADDPELSRHHAEIVRVGAGQFTIKDLSSTNGTFVNGTQLTAPVLLAVDDEIEVGGSKLVVRSGPAPAPPPDVDVRAPTVTVDVPSVMREPPREPSVPVEAPEPEPAPVLVRLTVDFEAEAAQLAVESGGEPIRLELDDGQWRVATGDA
jgi:pSer/pThr/pTyr-binding forkhead associated (FHA) protein